MYNQYNAGFNGMRQPYSYIRFMNGAPASGEVDIYANRSLIAGRLPYKGFTEYMQILPGMYDVQIFAAGTTMPVVETRLDVPVQSVSTAAVINTAAAGTAPAGAAPVYGFKDFLEPILQIPPGMLYLRFANLAPDAPELDMILSDGTRLFEGIPTGTASNYVAVHPRSYTFYLQLTGTDRSVLYVPNIQLTAGRFYTVYAVGYVKGTPPLQVLVPLDGNSYVKL